MTCGLLSVACHASFSVILSLSGTSFSCPQLDLKAAIIFVNGVLGREAAHGKCTTRASERLLCRCHRAAETLSGLKPDATRITRGLVVCLVEDRAPRPLQKPAGPVG